MRHQVPEKSQSQKFKETAKELGCDESEAVFNEKLGKMAQHKPEGELKKAKK
jgi:hypothetical protein